MIAVADCTESIKTIESSPVHSQMRREQERTLELQRLLRLTMARASDETAALVAEGRLKEAQLQWMDERIELTAREEQLVAVLQKYFGSEDGTVLVEENVMRMESTIQFVQEDMLEMERHIAKAESKLEVRRVACAVYVHTVRHQTPCVHCSSHRSIARRSPSYDNN